jgi:alpha-glucosidase
MQWDAGPRAGFTAATPWLPLSEDRATRNVAALEAEPRSILNLYRALIALRRLRLALSIGAFRLLAVSDDVLLYERRTDGERLVIALNLSAREQPLPITLVDARVLLSTHLDRRGAVDRAPLRPDEGLVLET